jgi:hypothetical protein
MINLNLSGSNGNVETATRSRIRHVPWSKTTLFKLDFFDGLPATVLSFACREYAREPAGLLFDRSSRGLSGARGRAFSRPQQSIADPLQTADSGALKLGAWGGEVKQDSSWFGVIVYDPSRPNPYSPRFASEKTARTECTDAPRALVQGSPPHSEPAVHPHGFRPDRQIRPG